MRLLVAVMFISMCGLIAGCGDEETVPDAEIVEALKLEKGPGSAGYTIGGDPFCEVSDELLNNATEVEEATSGRGDLELVITDSEETVGVEGVPPFDPECESDVRRALNKLRE